MRGKTIEVKCKNCNELFTARVADRKRGWGKFCSKSCKAKKQDYRIYTIPTRSLGDEEDYYYTIDDFE